MPTREQKALLTRLQRIQKALESAFEYLNAMMEEPEPEAEEEEAHAEYDSSEKGFVCLVGKKKACKELVYEAGEIVEHLRDEHGVDPDDQVIDGWTKKHDKQAEKYLASLEEEEEEEEEAYTKGELKDMSTKELQEILGDWQVKYPKKAKKASLIKLILEAQEEEEEEEEEAEEEEEEEEAEEEEEEEFTPYKLNSKEVKSFAKEHGLKKDEVALIVNYANQEEISLEEAAEEFEMVEEEEEEEEE